MIPRPGDVIQSNQRMGVRRFRVEKVIVAESQVYMECVCIPPDDGMPYTPRVEVGFSGLTVEGDKLVGPWTYPEQNSYAYLTEGFVWGQPAREEFRVIERGRHEEQLSLFGE